MRVVQLIIYGLWGVFLCLAALEKFGDFFAAGTGFWSVVMLSVAGLCQLLASAAAISWAVLGSSTLKAKYLPYKLVNNYTVPVLIIVLAVVASIARSSSDEARAQKLGFKDGRDFSHARENNITNATDYAKYLAEQKSKAEAKAAQDAALAAEKDQKAKEQEIECMRSDNPECYISKHERGDYVCEKAVEDSAKYEFKWTDGITEPKFSSLSWYDKNRRLVTLYGHRAQAQNGFGAFKNIQYSCTYNADTGEVLSTDLQ
ncbi:TPA: hypothetical protein MAD10_001217 [Klebsiella quasipneumoniae subsp. quasipneumoniae]|uniref:hypothetical protein n=1 Tax=Klebsiella pneumoniae TaxID=573 RepID=UPI001F214960|nr:hypothetical protein [Klebsiella pneumoniae]HBS1994880.1 hypothetical protein [Klebsiella quasipneumoniae subsp. quasipneumoniae]HED1423562.1 hypothetical protein [Klebsiella michiganensis]MCE7416953.1 hypothetical protein [Klebsiella pneumoniae]HBS6310625.1 hypothetical protein [Klebsiella pneumoniae]HBS6914302.1 hypothetical protein [Klebsiella pneumoniae]